MVDAAPDAKQKRYDRQIRVWGAHGQQALEAANVCLLNCSPTGSETLKNLVLGGIASFTIVDDRKVEPSDLGNNFMLEASHLGSSKAQCVTECLKELNEAVLGSFVEEDPVKLVNGNPSFFSRFSVVIATQMREQEVVQLETHCRSLEVYLLVARSYGLVGYLRASVPEHQVVESKPDNAVVDLRYHDPWPELNDCALSINLQSLDDVTHRHIPYAILLIRAANQWKSQHDGKLPKTSQERSQFKELLHSETRVVDGIPLVEENFDEALANANKVWAPGSIPAEVRQILDDDSTNVTSTSDDFWFMAAALKQFVDATGYLPLEGSIPDMTATTTLYLQLQRLYRDKADRDGAAVEATVRSLLESVGRDSSSIAKDKIKAFCKNARNIRLVRYRTIAEECSDSCRSVALRQALTAEDTASNAALYVLLRAADKFYATYNRYPGVFEGEVEDDVALLKTLAMSILAEHGASGTPVLDDLVGEMCRFGASELHCVAAIVGGMASQEAIKLITHQFVPLAGTLIFNAMASTSTVFLL